MAVSMTPGSSPGGRRALDAELNLVPFIDLLVCCICFLLITAVWVRMARIEVKSATRPGTLTEQRQRPQATPVKVLVDEAGYTVVAGAQRIELPRQGKHDDTVGLSRVLRQARRAGAASKLTIASVDGVAMRRLVAVLDLARGAQYGQLQLVDAAR